MLEFQSKSTVYSVQQSAENYLAAEEVLREMYTENKKFNLNSPIDIRQRFYRSLLAYMERRNRRCSHRQTKE